MLSEPEPPYKEAITQLSLALQKSMAIRTTFSRSLELYRVSFSEETRNMSSFLQWTYVKLGEEKQALEIAEQARAIELGETLIKVCCCWSVGANLTL